MLEQATEPGVADDVWYVIGQIGFVDHLQAVEWEVTLSMVRPELVIIIDIIVDEISQVPLTEGDRVIQALIYIRLDPAFDIRVDRFGDPSTYRDGNSPHA